MTTEQHTPLPWEVDRSRILWPGTPHKGTPEHPEFVVAQCGVFTGQGPGTHDEREANAAFIVRAVNAHEKLVEITERLYSLVLDISHKSRKSACLGTGDKGCRCILCLARAALAEAKGE